MPSDTEYVERAREERHSPNVLRLRVLQIRSGRPGARILVFEGVDDVGPYEVWINSVVDKPDYVPLPSKGKRQVLAFAEQELHEREDSEEIYFLVDHDFDGLRGVDEHENLFCTECYSIENYLCCRQVLESILRDDFRLAERQLVVDQVIRVFERVLEEFRLSMLDANKRAYCGSKFGIRGGNIENRVRRYIQIGHDSVRVNPSIDLSNHVPLVRDPVPEELTEADEYLRGMERFISRSRGKFLLQFFCIWLEEIHEAFQGGSISAIDGAEVDSRFRRPELTMRNLASRVSPPGEIRVFLENCFWKNQDTHDVRG